MQVETLNPYYDPRKSSVVNLKAWRAALEGKKTPRGGKNVAKPVQCIEAGGDLMKVGDAFDKAADAAKILNVHIQRVNDSANSGKGVGCKIDGEIYRFKYV